MDVILNALAEPNRRKILALLRGSERAAGAIADSFMISRPAVSQHLKVLVDSGLVTMRKDGVRRLYRLRPEGLNDLRHYLESFWDAPLERLKRAAEAEDRRHRHG
jgi:DNA-binding transcriptional ArsR family regulator